MKKYIFGVYAALLVGNVISADFTGSWGYVRDIPDGVYGKYFNIKQSSKYIPLALNFSLPISVIALYLITFPK